MGSIFVFRLSARSWRRTEDAVRAWIFAAGLLDLRDQAEGLRAGAGAQGAQAELAALLRARKARAARLRLGDINRVDARSSR